MSEAHVETVEGEGFRLVVFRHEERLNALTSGMMDALAAAVEACGADGRDLVLKGGGGNFSSGADLREVAGSDHETARRRALECRKLCAAVASGRFRSAALVQGVCFGKGLELALACRLVVAAPGSLFAFPEYALGFEPPCGGAELARERCGRPPFALTKGKRLTAREAEAAGLADLMAELPPDGRIPSEWWEKARPPFELPPGEEAAKRYAARVSSPEVKEALRAFLSGEC